MALVTVIMPCYNQGFFLSEAIKSLIQQKFQDWECIIVNDGSTDRTGQEALNWCKKDQRIRYLVKENGGLSSSRNAGMRAATGHFIQFLDADDIIHPNKFHSAIEAFKRNESVELVISDFWESQDSVHHTYHPWCTLHDKEFSYKSILLDWEATYTIPIHCAVFRKSLLQDFRFNEDLAGKEDWLMWLYIFKRNTPYVFINERQAVYRHHYSGMTKNPISNFNNVCKAYNYVLLNEDLGELLQPFSIKINSFWRNQMVQTMKSRKYRWGTGLVEGFNTLKKITGFSQLRKQKKWNL